MTTREMIEVLEGFERGEAVQCRRNDRAAEWKDTPAPNWNFSVCDYRLKPKQREIWVNEYNSGFGGVFPSKEAAENAGSERSIACLHFIEVLDE